MDKKIPISEQDRLLDLFYQLSDIWFERFDSTRSYRTQIKSERYWCYSTLAFIPAGREAVEVNVTILINGYDITAKLTTVRNTGEFTEKLLDIDEIETLKDVTEWRIN